MSNAPQVARGLPPRRRSQTTAAPSAPPLASRKDAGPVTGAWCCCPDPSPAPPALTLAATVESANTVEVWPRRVANGLAGARSCFQSEAEDGRQLRSLVVEPAAPAPPPTPPIPPPPAALPSRSSSTEKSSTAPCVPTALANTVPSLENTASFTSTPGAGGGSSASSLPDAASKNETTSASEPTATRFSLFPPGHHAREIAAQRGTGLGGAIEATIEGLLEEEEEGLFEEEEGLVFAQGSPVRASKRRTVAPSSEAAARTSGRRGCHASLLTLGGRDLDAGAAFEEEVEEALWAAPPEELGRRISPTGRSAGGWFWLCCCCCCCKLALKLGLVLSGAQILMQPSTPPEARRWAEQDQATEVA